MLWVVMLCYVMLCYVMLCYVMLCYVMLCDVMLWDVIVWFISVFNVIDEVRFDWEKLDFRVRALELSSEVSDWETFCDEKKTDVKRSIVL